MGRRNKEWTVYLVNPKYDGDGIEKVRMRVAGSDLCRACEVGLAAGRKLFCADLVLAPRHIEQFPHLEEMQNPEAKPAG